MASRSVARGEARIGSDVDLLVTFLPDAEWSLLDHVAIEDDLSPALRDANPSIPWRQMAGMRDKLVHACDAVDLEEVWRRATVDVSALAAALSPHTQP